MHNQSCQEQLAACDPVTKNKQNRCGKVKQVFVDQEQRSKHYIENSGVFEHTACYLQAQNEMQ